MIVHTCFNNSSIHGYKSSILKSGICKYIRRNEPEKFKWCVMEMSQFNEHPNGKALVTNLINRLKIVLMEELSFHETVISSFLALVLDMYDKDRSDYRLLYSFCDIVFEAKRNRCVSYQNSWWRGKGFNSPLTKLDQILKFKKEGDTDELLLIGENLIHFVKHKDERMFGCYHKMSTMDNQGLRWRRRDASYLWFEILEEYMNTDDLKYIFKFTLEQFHKKGMTERYAFGNWLGLMVWKREHLTTSEEGIPYELSSKEVTDKYIFEMSKLEIDGYVIKDHHVISSYGLGHFAENGAYVKDEYLDLMDEAKEKKEWYIKEKYMKDNCEKVIPERYVYKEIIKFIDWSKFSDVKILEEGVCGGKVCCISVTYEGKKYILKEMKESMNHGRDYILVDTCKEIFELTHMNMRRIKSNAGQLKIDPMKKSYVNNVKIDFKECMYCMMDYWPNIGDLGKNKEYMNDLSVKKEALKIRLFDGLFCSSDNILRNILVNEFGDLLSIDEGDIYGKRKKIFNKTDWFMKPENCNKELVDSVLQDLLEDEDMKLALVKEQFLKYKFTNYGEFVTRWSLYRLLVYEELGIWKPN